MAAEVENRIAVISIIIEDLKNAGRINELLSENAEHIIGRMGIPTDTGIYPLSASYSMHPRMLSVRFRER